MEDLTVKLGDLGIARIFEKEKSMTTATLGTPYYLSPEICANEKYSYPSDIWSCGVLLYELCASGKYPYDGKDFLELAGNIRDKTF